MITVEPAEARKLIEQDAPRDTIVLIRREGRSPLALVSGEALQDFIELEFRRLLRRLVELHFANGNSTEEAHETACALQELSKNFTSLTEAEVESRVAEWLAAVGEGYRAAVSPAPVRLRKHIGKWATLAEEVIASLIEYYLTYQQNRQACAAELERKRQASDQKESALALDWQSDELPDLSDEEEAELNRVIAETIIEVRAEKAKPAGR